MQIQLDILYIFLNLAVSLKKQVSSQEQERTRLNMHSAIHTAILRKQEAREAGTEIGKGRGGLDSDL